MSNNCNQPIECCLSCLTCECCIREFVLYYCSVIGTEARQAIAANDGIQATLIAMEIGSQDPQIQSCGLALLSCAIVESMI